MVLTEKVVLFHDHPPHGQGIAEVLDAGFGLVPGLVVLPDPRRRLRLDDRERVGRLAQRFAPAACVAMDHGRRDDLPGRPPGPPRVAAAPHRQRHGGAGGAAMSEVAQRAIDAFQAGPRTPEAVDAFLAGHTFPIVEGETITFVHRGDAEAVHLKHWVYGLPSSQQLSRDRGDGPLVPHPRAAGRLARRVQARGRPRRQRRSGSRTRSTRTARATRSAPTRWRTAAATRCRSGPSRIRRRARAWSTSCSSTAIPSDAAASACTCRRGFGAPGATRCSSSTTATTTCATPASRPSSTTSSTDSRSRT